MRLDRLDLIRFGCFTDCSLDLSRPGVHVVVGPNEAGKTTAMIAIGQLLFGLPHRSVHAFEHALRDLSIGARLRDDAGEILEVVRVKRNVGTLRDLRGDVLDDRVLADLLCAVDENLFSTLFSIGHDEIVRGGAALLANDGELGRALFGASRGTTDLNAILRRLDERAAGLFKSSASIPKVNAAIRGYKEELAEARAMSLSASEVLELDRALESALVSYEQIACERKALAAKRTLLDRVKATRPLLAGRRDHQAALVELEESGPVVSTDVGEVLASAQTQRENGVAQRRMAQAVVDRLKDRVDMLVVDRELLERREVIQALHAEAGAFEQNNRDLPGLFAKAGTARRHVVELRGSLPASCALRSDGRPAQSVDQLKRIDELAAGHDRLETQLEAATDQVDDASGSVASLRRDLADLEDEADVGGLAEIISRVRRAGDAEALLADATHRLAETDMSLRAVVAALGLTGLDPRTVDAVSVPSAEVIRQHREGFDQSRINVLKREGEIADLKTQRDAIEQELIELLRAAQPPSEEDLVAGRAHRDEGWRLVCEAWLDGLADTDAIARWSGGETLAEAYSTAVFGADDLADRLRAEANAVERRASLEARIEAIDRRLATRHEDLEDAIDRRRSANSAWEQLWAPVGIAAPLPLAAEAWRDDFRQATQLAGEARRFLTDIAVLEASVARHCSDLRAALAQAGVVPAPDTSLLGLLDFAEQAVLAATEGQLRRRGLAEAIAGGEKRLAQRVAKHLQAERAFATWREGWIEAVATVGLHQSAQPPEAAAVLRALDELVRTMAELDDIERRIAGIERRNGRFTEAVSAVIHELQSHQDLVGASPDAAVASLARRLEKALQVAIEYRTTAEELASHVDLCAQAVTLMADANERIAQLIATSGVANEAGLDDAVDRSRQVLALRLEIAQVDEALRQATGLTVDRVETEADELADVEIDAEVEDLGGRIELLDDALRAEGVLVGELQTRRSLIDGSGKAADAMTRAQQSLATVASCAEEYVEVVLARSLLEEQIAAYRDKHQGPLLARARELFQELTLGNYLGLDTDTDDKGTPYLLACGAAGTLVEVAALSTGTRDQLYLALRLAALEHVIGQRGALPVVLDDLFVHFDDRRTAAGLRILDELARRTQVLLFTHHEQVARQASDVIDEGRLTIHHLGASSVGLDAA